MLPITPAGGMDELTADALRWFAVATLVGVVLFHGGRLWSAGARRRHADMADELTHAGMGLVMVVMLVGALSPADSRRLAFVFLAPLAWFAWRVLHVYVMDGSSAVGGPARQTVGCGAMVYSLAVLSTARAGSVVAGSSMPGMSMPSRSSLQSLSFPAPSVVTAALVAATVAVAAVTVLRPRAVGLPVTPALAAGCQVAMSTSMVYMLVAR